MNFEVMEQWLIAHYPKSRCYNKILNRLKLMVVSRHKMSRYDRIAVEMGKISKHCIVRKYKKKWRNYTNRILSKFEEYLKCCKEQSLYDNYESIKDDVLFCNYAYGFMPDEYFAYRLASKTSEEIQEFISDRDRLIFIYKVNDIVDLDIYRNKNHTYKLLQKYYKRDAVPIQNISDFSAFSSFVDKHPVFVQKNVRKNCGQGVELINFSNCKLPPKAYFKKLIENDEYLLEECIVQSKEMNKLNESSVNTVRCTTFVTNQGIIIDHCFLRVGRNQSFIDNGAAGGLLIGIDKKTGVLDTEAYTEFLEFFSEHPESKVKFKGYQLPEWDSLLQLAKELATILPSVRFVGWDFSHTPRGWALVEANGRAQLIAPQIVYRKGIRKRFFLYEQNRNLTESRLLNVVMIGVAHSHATGVMEELRKKIWEETFHVLGCVEASDEVWEEKSATAPFNNLPRFDEKDVLANNLKEGKVDAVLIETKTKDLILTAQKYLAMKIPIHIDKPTGIDEKFLTLMDNAKCLNVPIQLGYVFRYNSAVCAAKSYINDGKIGTICHIDAFMNTELTKNERITMNEYTGGAMYLYGCYMLDIAMQFMGEPKAIHSFINQTGFDKIDSKDSTLAYLEYEHGTATIQAIETDANGYGRRQVVITGSKGSIEIKPIENPIRMTYAPRDGQKTYQDKAEAVNLSKWPYKGRYYYMIADFAKMIQGETSQMIFPMDYDYEKKLHKLLLAAIGVEV